MHKFQKGLAGGRKQNAKSYLLYHSVSFRDTLQQITNLEYQ